MRGKFTWQWAAERAEDMENLDPKAVFANERTLLHYAEKGMWLADWICPRSSLLSCGEGDSRNSEVQPRYVGAVAVVVLHQGGRYKVHSRWHVER